MIFKEECQNEKKNILKIKVLGKNRITEPRRVPFDKLRVNLQQTML